jgi:hypothetical protein
VKKLEGKFLQTQLDLDTYLYICEVSGSQGGEYEALSTSESSVNFYQTARHNIPGDSHLHTYL